MLPATAQNCPGGKAEEHLLFGICVERKKAFKKTSHQNLDLLDMDGVWMNSRLEMVWFEKGSIAWESVT